MFVQIEITQINMQLFFKELVFQDQAKFIQTFLGCNFTLHESRNEHSDKTTALFKDGFRVSVVSSNALPNRILQIVSFPNSVAEPDQAARRFLSMTNDILLRDLGIDAEKETYACRVVFHSIVKSERNVPKILAMINDISDIRSLDKYAAHKNPFNALQLTEKIGATLEHEEWHDIRISPFNSNAYVVTIFYECRNVKYVMRFLERVRDFVTALVGDIEKVAS